MEGIYHNITTELNYLYSKLPPAPPGPFQPGPIADIRRELIQTNNTVNLLFEVSVLLC